MDKSNHQLIIPLTEKVAGKEPRLIISQSDKKFKIAVQLRDGNKWQHKSGLSVLTGSFENISQVLNVFERFEKSFTLAYILNAEVVEE